MIALTKKIVPASKLAEYLAKRPPEYASEIEPAITQRFADGSIEVDTHHPAWQAAMAKYRSTHHIKDCFVQVVNPSDPSKSTAARADLCQRGEDL